jgi:hypothetical protein
MTFLFEFAGLVVFAVVFVLFGRFVLRSLARWGKWTDLATSYRDEGEFSGPTKSLQSGSFGPFVHKGTLVLGADADALHVSMLPVFRYAHPSLRIPWEDVTVRRRKGILAEHLVMTLRNQPFVEIYVRPSTASLLTTWSKGAFKPPS